jgi:hypothetical protein
VGVDRGISGSSSEILAISVWDVFSSLGVSESLGKAEVDDVDIVLLLANANQKVIWLDVSVQEVSGVHKLNSLQLRDIRLHNEVTI